MLYETSTIFTDLKGIVGDISKVPGLAFSFSIVSFCREFLFFNNQINKFEII